MGQAHGPTWPRGARPIELLVVDVDGVLTDGVIAIDDRGVETKHFHVRDGLADRALAPGREAGGDPLGPTGRGGRPPGRRAQASRPWSRGWPRRGSRSRALLAELGLEPRQVCFVGDDLVDLPVLGVGRPGRLSRRMR